jgi:hypothetical protein
MVLCILTQLRAEIAAAATLEQRTQSFTIVLKGSVADATPLSVRSRLNGRPVGHRIFFIP